MSPMETRVCDHDPEAHGDLADSVADLQKPSECGGVKVQCAPCSMWFPTKTNRRIRMDSPVCWCGKRESNPYGKTTRPSNVRVCQFRHSRRTILIIHYSFRFVNTFFEKNPKKIKPCERRANTDKKERTDVISVRSITCLD